MRCAFLGFLGSLQACDSGNTSLVVQGKRGTILVDVSSAPASALRRLNLDPVALDAVVLTHAHVDHLYALPSLLHNLWLLKRTKPLPIIANKETLSKAKALCAVFGLEQKKAFYGITWTEAVEADIGTMHLDFFPTDHGVPSVALSITEGDEKLVYSSDTRPMPFPSFTHHANLLIHEASGTAETEEKLLTGGHSSGRDAKACMTAIEAKRLLLCHLPLDEQVRQKIAKEAKPGTIPSLEQWIALDKEEDHE